MIHLFSGFLGKPSDLDFFKVLGPSKSYDMKDFDDESFTCDDEDILIGYSMGGRVALKIAHRLQYKIKKVIILNANPHTLDPHEKEKREQWEESIKEMMETLSPDEFLKYWNGLGLFTHDLPISGISSSDLKVWAQTFKKHRLSNQEDYFLDLKNHPDKFSWIVGSLDEKYFNIAQNSGLKFYSIQAGHRLFQHPQKILDLIERENLL